MKSFYNLFFLPFILVICFTIFTGFSNSSEYNLVEKLLKERTDILHKVYFHQLDYEKAEALLYEIETQPLLAEDIKELRNYENSDMDFVKDMEILAMDKVSNLYGRKSYRADILWYMQGMDNRYVQSIEYNIVTKRAGSGYKLSEFKVFVP